MGSGRFVGGFEGLHGSIRHGTRLFQPGTLMAGSAAGWLGPVLMATGGTGCECDAVDWSEDLSAVTDSTTEPVTRTLVRSFEIDFDTICSEAGTRLELEIPDGQITYGEGGTLAIYVGGTPTGEDGTLIWFGNETFGTGPVWSNFAGWQAINPIKSFPNPGGISYIKIFANVGSTFNPCNCAGIRNYTPSIRIACCTPGEEVFHLFDATERGFSSSGIPQGNPAGPFFFEIPIGKLDPCLYRIVVNSDIKWAYTPAVGVAGYQARFFLNVSGLTSPTDFAFNTSVRLDGSGLCGIISTPGSLFPTDGVYVNRTWLGYVGSTANHYSEFPGPLNTSYSLYFWGYLSFPETTETGYLLKNLDIKITKV